MISSPCDQSLLESFNKVKAAEEAVIEKKYGSMDPVERFRAERSAAAGKAMWAERKERAGKEVMTPLYGALQSIMPRPFAGCRAAGYRLVDEGVRNGTLHAAIHERQ